MIVVAIIGILAAVAVPNYQKYQSKARQSEARIALAAVYTAEKAFQVESGKYTSCATDIGVDADGSNNYYSVGFSTGGATAADDDCGDASCATATLCSTAAERGYVAGKAFGSATATTLAAGNGSMPPTIVDNSAAGTSAAPKFLAGAAGMVSDSSLDSDQWTMNDNKELSNFRPAL